MRFEGPPRTGARAAPASTSAGRPRSGPASPRAPHRSAPRPAARGCDRPAIGVGAPVVVRQQELVGQIAHPGIDIEDVEPASSARTAASACQRIRSRISPASITFGRAEDMKGTCVAIHGTPEGDRGPAASCGSPPPPRRATSSTPPARRGGAPPRSSAACARMSASSQSVAQGKGLSSEDGSTEQAPVRPRPSRLRPSSPGTPPAHAARHSSCRWRAAPERSGSSPPSARS
jgi:hypothetical protein